MDEHLSESPRKWNDEDMEHTASLMIRESWWFLFALLAFLLLLHTV